MIAFLYAFLFGGVLAAAGGGSGGASTTTPSASASAPRPDPRAAGETPPVADDPPESEPEPMLPSVEAGPVGGGGVTPVSPSLPASAYDIGWDGLTAEEQFIVEMVNRARLDPQAEVRLYNEPLASGISSSPVQALAVDPELSDASRGHSEDMDNRDYFSHTNPDGDGPGARALDAGYGSRFVGENIGWRGATFPEDAQDRAEDHHEGLWRSDGHQRNLMSENWSEIGVGYDYASYRGYNHSTFVTEMFGDKGTTYLTGVVIDDDDSDQFYDIGEGQGDVRITAFAGEDVYATATWESGGYSLALPPGTYRVLFEGGDLDAPYETEVTIGNENVKLDVMEDGGSVLASLNAGPPLPGIPVVEQQSLSAMDAEAEEALFELV